MTFPSISSADFITQEEREEQRFLRNLKGVLRMEVAALMERDGLTQAQAADRLGYDPGQLSRVLSPDRHGATASMFRVLFRLGKRWTFSAVPVPVPVPDGNRAPERVMPRVNPVLAGSSGGAGDGLHVARPGVPGARTGWVAVTG